jgi:YHS domain-containing protein
MAHRSDVIQIPKDFSVEEHLEMTEDRCCGKKLTKKEARHVMFLEDDTLYFCTKDCLEKYRVSLHAPPSARIA